MLLCLKVFHNIILSLPSTFAVSGISSSYSILTASPSSAAFFCYDLPSHRTLPKFDHQRFLDGTAGQSLNMHRLQSLLLVGLFIVAAFASPIQHQQKKRSFKVSRIRQADYVPNGGAALRKAYTKFGIEGSALLPELAVHTTLTASEKAASSNESGDVTATPTQDDAEFLSPISVGGQTMVMDFDTGSSDL